MFRFLLFYALLLVGGPVCAQSTSYRVVEYTTDNGMPSNGIKGMQWDENTGFLWVATEAGVARFNGIDFSIFSRENTPGLRAERTAYIEKNNRGQIFVADVNNQILEVQENRLIPREYPFLKTVEGFKKRHYLSMTGPVRETVLMYILQSGSEQIDNVFQLDDSTAILATGRRGFYRLKAGSPVFDSLPIPKERRVSFLMEGKLFINDLAGTTRLYDQDGKNGKPVQILEKESGRPLSLRDNNYLLYWDNGMPFPVLLQSHRAWRLTWNQDHIEAVLICDAIPLYSHIRSVQYSRKNQILFIGTDSKGIIVITPNRLESVKKKTADIRERNAYYSQVELPGGQVLTNEGHILGPSAAGTQVLPIRNKFNYTVYNIGDSLLWYAQVYPVTGTTLLHQYDYRTGRTRVFPRTGPLQESFSLLVTGGKTVVGTNRGLGLLEADSIRYLFRVNPPGDNSSAPNAIVEWEPGVVIQASCQGLIRYNLNTIKSDTLLRFPGYCIRGLLRYRDYLFIGSYGKGFYIWKNGRLHAMPLDKNQFLRYTHCFVPDSLGYCWISTNRGLFKARMNDLLDAFENKRTELYYHYLGKNDGMEITELNGGCNPCALLLKNGTISFPTMDGLLWLNPSLTVPLLPDGNIFLDVLRAGNRVLQPDSAVTLSLSPKENDIRLEIGFSAWCNKENIYLSYRLNNGEWTEVDLNAGALIQLRNLSPGEYRLVIRKRNGFGIDNYSYREIGFSIRTPWYGQWWFFAGAALLLVGLLSLYLRWRTRQLLARQQRLEQQVAEKTSELTEQNEMLEKNNQLKTRLISIISHDLVTPLKFLTVAGKNLIEKRKQMPEALQQETIAEMVNTSQELQLLSTNILNWIKYQNENRRLVKELFSIREPVSQVLGILNSLAAQKNLRIVNEVEAGLEIRQFYEPLKILVYNLLTNAINFSEAGTIIIRGLRENGEVIVSVTDEGTGMTPEQVQRLLEEDVIISSANVDNRKGHGLGYLIIKDLIKTMGARLQIDSSKGRGTTVRIRIPE